MLNTRTQHRCPPPSLPPPILTPPPHPGLIKGDRNRSKAVNLASLKKAPNTPHPPGTCVRGTCLVPVGEQSILNVVGQGAMSGGSFVRFRIEEVSKNHQSNYFRVVFTQGDQKVVSRRIFVKSKKSQSKCAPAVDDGGSRKRTRSDLPYLNCGREQVVKSLGVVRSWTERCVAFVREFELKSAIAGGLVAEYDLRLKAALDTVEGGMFAEEERGSDVGSEGDVRNTLSGVTDTLINMAVKGGNTPRGSDASLPSSFPMPRALPFLSQSSLMLPPQPPMLGGNGERSMSMNLSFMDQVEVKDMEVTLAAAAAANAVDQHHDPDSEMPPEKNPGLIHRVSSHYIGPGRDNSKHETHNVKATIEQFHNTELAVGYTCSTKLLEGSTAIQSSVHYILAKLWCGEEESIGGIVSAYGFPAFDDDKQVLGFYREVYDLEDAGEEKTPIGVFIPITDIPELGKTQRGDLEVRLEQEILAKSGSVCTKKDSEIKKLIEMGFTYAWTKLMYAVESTNNNSISGFW